MKKRRQRRLQTLNIHNAVCVINFIGSGRYGTTMLVFGNRRPNEMTGWFRVASNQPVSYFQHSSDDD
jgi:hypothetical protein